MHLYEITGELNQVLQLGEEGVDVADTLESIEMALEDKALNIVYVIKNHEAMAESLKKEKERFTEREKAYRNRAKKLADYLKFNLEQSKLDKLELKNNEGAPIFTVSLQKNVPSVKIDDPVGIPEEYIVVSEVRNPDKKAILDDLKKGVEIKGATLVKDKTHLRIR